MAALIANKPPKLLVPVHHDDANYSATDSDSDDDLSLCDLPIRAPSFRAAGINEVVGTSDGPRNKPRVPSSTVSVDADYDDDNDPFEFFGASRHGNGMCSPSDVFYGGRMFPTQAAARPPPAALTSALSRAAANSTGLPPPAMSRRSRSEGVRRPPPDPAVYNRSASVEGRGRATGTAVRKGDYQRLPPLIPAALRSTSSEHSAGPSTGSTKIKSSGGGGTITCSVVDPVPSCGPRPKWYVFATFASVKPPQGEMDMKDIRTRQKKRNTQQECGGPAAAAPTARLGAGAGAGGRRGRKSWLLLNSLSCKVDVDALAWTPSGPPMPLPERPHHEPSPWR